MVTGSHKMSRRSFVGRLAMMGVFFAAGSLPTAAFANVPSIELEAGKLDGDEFEVTVKVSHKGNNFFHYVDRVALFRDGEEIKVWGYSRNERPESENFSVTTRVSVKQETVFSAAAHCNLHGENKDKAELKLLP